MIQHIISNDNLKQAKDEMKVLFYVSSHDIDPIFEVELKIRPTKYISPLKLCGLVGQNIFTTNNCY